MYIYIVYSFSLTKSLHTFIIEAINLLLRSLRIPLKRTCTDMEHLETTRNINNYLFSYKKSQ